MYVISLEKFFVYIRMCDDINILYLTGELEIYIILLLL